MIVSTTRTSELLAGVQDSHWFSVVYELVRPVGIQGAE